MISIIAAIGKNRELGVKNRIPWHIREDLLRFKSLTLDKTVIVGRVTFESLLVYYRKSGRPLPKRNYIIVSRKPGYKPDFTGINLTENSRHFIVQSLDSALNEAKKLTDGEIFIIGGASIYREGIDRADKLYLTKVEREYPEADVFFPDYSGFKKVSESEAKHTDDIQYKFIELEREKVLL